MCERCGLLRGSLRGGVSCSTAESATAQRTRREREESLGSRAGQDTYLLDNGLRECLAHGDEAVEMRFGSSAATRGDGGVSVFVGGIGQRASSEQFGVEIFSAAVLAPMTLKRLDWFAAQRREFEQSCCSPARDLFALFLSLRFASPSHAVVAGRFVLLAHGISGGAEWSGVPRGALPADWKFRFGVGAWRFS